MTLPAWVDANQRYLAARLSVVRQALENCACRMQGGDESPGQIPAPSSAIQKELLEASADLPAPSALDILCDTFGLSSFERDILLLCAGMELDARTAALCARAHGDARSGYPTFSLALSAMENAHWNAVTPGAPLRRFRLVDVGVGDTLMTSRLRTDEKVVHYLVGIRHLDERLAGFMEPASASSDLMPSHRAQADWIAVALSQTPAKETRPALVLFGDSREAQIAIAVSAAKAAGMNPWLMRGSTIPTQPSELEAVVRLWERDAALENGVLVLDLDEGDAAEAGRAHAVDRLIESVGSVLIVCTRERRRTRQRPILTLEVSRPSSEEQRSFWRQALGTVAEQLDGKIDALVSQFNMTVLEIGLACQKASASSSEGGEMAEKLWNACREQTGPRMNDLAHPIRSGVEWDDLVLPELQRQVLREIAVHVRQRMKVYETWGFGRKSSRGLGISALFAGPSGTGKTLAAEVLANELRLDLYRIDLSQVVSKYIGETEKNLRRLFDAAEGGGAILLFDEADALFGKRSEVKDSHDRYANIEVSYLLQRMEAYRGLAILTTNSKSSLDGAFLRRIRFIVQFPFPDALSRAEIWRRVFPATTPVAGIDSAKLARLNVAGGSIRNIALGAAFFASDAGEPVTMGHILRAARGECAKLETTLSEAEIGGWT